MLKYGAGLRYVEDLFSIEFHYENYRSVFLPGIYQYIYHGSFDRCRRVFIQSSRRSKNRFLFTKWNGTQNS